MRFTCHNEKVVLDLETRAGIPAAVEACIDEMDARDVRWGVCELERGSGVRVKLSPCAFRLRATNWTGIGGCP